MKKRLIALIALQVILLLSIVAKYYYIATTGTLVTLKTAPVDPTDLFYGDYVIVNYEISRIEAKKVKHDLTDRMADHTVYVVLENKGKPYHEAVGIYQNKPELKENQVNLKAKMIYYDDFADVYNLKYGIERYYVPENTGREIEQNREDRLMDIRVSGSGEAIIEKLRK